MFHCRIVVCYVLRERGKRKHHRLTRWNPTMFNETSRIWCKFRRHDKERQREKYTPRGGLYKDSLYIWPVGNSVSMWQRRIYPSLCFFLPRVEARFVGHASFSSSDEPAVGHRGPIALCTHSRKFLLPLPRHHLTPHPPYSFILLFDPTSDELGCCLRLYSLVHSLFSNLFSLSVFHSTVASSPHHLCLSLRSDSLRD